MQNCTIAMILREFTTKNNKNNEKPKTELILLKTMKTLKMVENWKY